MQVAKIPIEKVLNLTVFRLLKEVFILLRIFFVKIIPEEFKCASALHITIIKIVAMVNPCNIGGRELVIVEKKLAVGFLINEERAITVIIQIKADLTKPYIYIALLEIVLSATSNNLCTTIGWNIWVGKIKKQKRVRYFRDS